MQRSSSGLFLALALTLSTGCAASSEDTPSVESAEDEANAAFVCDYVSGGDARNYSGDGEPLRIALRAGRSGELTAVLESQHDLDDPELGGLHRDCTRSSERDGASEVWICSNEFEWGHFDVTSTLRLPDGALRRRSRPFELVYRAATADRRFRTGVREHEASARTFRCHR